MVELMPFGKHNGKSVEQIVLQDYNYFNWLNREAKIYKNSLRQRIELVDYASNNFISTQPCQLQDCQEPAQLVSIYHNWDMNYRGSSHHFIYCSQECFNQDPSITDDKRKASLEPLRFLTALSSTKYDTNKLIELFAWTMGIKDGRRTKEYLEDFFNNVKTKPR